MRISLSCCALVLLGCGGAADVGDLIAAESQAGGGLGVAPGTTLPNGMRLRAAGRQPFASGTLPNPEHAPCLFGTSDGAGDVALGRGLENDATWSFYSAAGLPLGTATGDPDPLHGDTLGRPLYPGATGFQIAAVLHGTQVGDELVTFAVDGTRLAETPLGGRTTTVLYLSSIPAGGVGVAAFSDLSRAAGVSWLDDHGNGLGSSFIDVPPPYDDVRALVATDAQSHALALYPGLEALRARWFDVDGAPRGDELTLALGPDLRLSPLIGGGFAVRTGDDWTGVIASDGTTVAPAPAWLRHRPRTRLVLVAGGALYALLFDDGETAPARPQWIELRRPDGAWAGALFVWFPDSDATSQRTRIGRDGTLVQLVSRTASDGTECAYRWWPGLLRSGVDADGTAFCAGGACL